MLKLIVQIIFMSLVLLEIIYLYLAKNLSKTHQHLDENEALNKDKQVELL